MPRTKQGGQASFEDVPLMVEDLVPHIEKFLETQRAASNHQAADREIKKLVPSVEKATRFAVG